jgi:hypothetical protein
VLFHPHYSFDLDPCGFCLFPMLKQYLSCPQTPRFCNITVSSWYT